jgi:hypothetical protein
LKEPVEFNRCFLEDQNSILVKYRNVVTGCEAHSDLCRYNKPLSIRINL